MRLVVVGDDWLPVRLARRVVARARSVADAVSDVDVVDYLSQPIDIKGLLARGGLSRTEIAARADAGCRTGRALLTAYPENRQRGLGSR